MKIRLFLALFLAASFGLQAQNSKVVSAFIAYEDAVGKLALNNVVDGAKSLTEAVKNIEPATTHEKSMIKEKTWRYRGDIYTLVAQYYDKPEIKAIDADPISKAKESYVKQMELDQKGSYKKEVTASLTNVMNFSQNFGVEYFQEKDYKAAYQSFSQCNEIAKIIGVVNPDVFFNTGLAAEQAGMTDEALAIYKQCLADEYGGADMYYTVINIYKKADDNENAAKYLEEGLAKYPSNEGLLGEKVNMDLGSGDSKGAQEGVMKMIEKDPDNPNLRFVLGNTLDKEGKTKEAVEAYKKAIELKPDYFDAIYNIGALYFNNAVEANEVCNDIPTKEFKKYDECKENVKGMFKEALPYFEQAKGMKGDDQGTLQSLMQIYGQLGDTEKQIEMRNLLGL
ncbi:MAG: tetratricopeptide repeat protein [Bacteroidota bacterium]